MEQKDLVSFEIRVISSAIGNLFVFGVGQEVKASNRLACDTLVSGCTFVVFDHEGLEKDRYYIVGNSYDYDTRFTPKQHDWFADGVVSDLNADFFTAGDVIQVTFNRPTHLGKHEQFQAKMAVWVVLTHQAGSAGYLDTTRVSQLLRSRRQKAEQCAP